jgi:hypothetical protein
MVLAAAASLMAMDRAAQLFSFLLSIPFAWVGTGIASLVYRSEASLITSCSIKVLREGDRLACT